MSDLQNEPLTFEKVWAALMENREQMKETDRQMKETDRRMQETDRLMKETYQRMQETDRQIKATDRQIGKLGNRFGDLVEHLVVPGIVDKFNMIGYQFTRHSERVKYHDPQTGKVLAEVDILLENGDVVIAVEVKSTLHTEDVNEHLERMEILRRLRRDSRKYRGALAGAIITEGAIGYAQKSGFYVLEQTGDTMKLDVPPGFVPRDW